MTLSTYAWLWLMGPLLVERQKEGDMPCDAAVMMDEAEMNIFFNYVRVSCGGHRAMRGAFPGRDRVHSRAGTPLVPCSCEYKFNTEIWPHEYLAGQWCNSTFTDKPTLSISLSVFEWGVDRTRTISRNL
jgi:hypothetical protein